jgi:hypothetical protein
VVTINYRIELLNGKMTDERRTGKHLDETGNDLTGVLSRHLPVSTEKNHEHSVNAPDVEAEMCKRAPPKYKRIAQTVHEATVFAKYFRNTSKSKMRQKALKSELRINLALILFWVLKLKPFLVRLLNHIIFHILKLTSDSVINI